MFVSERVIGSGEEARNRVRAYFDDLRDTINKQEEAGLAVVNNFVREKLCSLRQQQEDVAVFMSQVRSPIQFMFYYIVLYYIMLYYIMLCHSILYYTMLYCLILYYAMLYYIILYYIILYHTVLCCSILYYIMLYYLTIQCNMI